MLPFDITEIVAAGLADGRREHDGLLHASSHILGSLRHTQLDVAGAPKITSQLVRDVRLHTGTMWHTQLDEWFKRERAWVMPNVDMTPFLPKGWGGTLDYLVYNPELASFGIVDLKTIKGDGLRWIHKSGPKEEHVYQTSMYWWGVKAAGLPLIKQIGVYYLPISESREEQVEPVLVTFDPLPKEQFDQLIAGRTEAVREYVSSLPFGSNDLPFELDGEHELTDWLTDKLAPVQERVLTWKYRKREGKWELLLMPHWSTGYCDYPDELCDCRTQGQNKVGEMIEDIYVPREGYEHIDPPSLP
jgi:hypothetical protein